MFLKETLQKYGISRKIYKKKDVLFREEEKASCLLYLSEGEVKIFNTDSEGKDFLITKISGSQFMGEPPFLLGERYPATAIVSSEEAEIYRFDEEQFQTFMKSNPDLLYEFTKEIARKAYNKTLTIKSIVHQNPHERILNFMKHYKKSLGVEATEKMMIDVTRKEIASSTGLAVETVIRAVKKMEKAKMLELINHKIYY
ncbi:MAG: Crp/Fnr family transcriptional regulator [Cruoricaptor ignavus]|nr:Crp/Fnr family transcriptional regulator [Cruoricaptor ignavus]